MLQHCYHTMFITFHYNNESRHITTSSPATTCMTNTFYFFNDLFRVIFYLLIHLHIYLHLSSYLPHSSYQLFNSHSQLIYFLLALSFINLLLADLLFSTERNQMLRSLLHLKHHNKHCLY